MTTLFCPHCGSKNYYDFEKPAFCGKCGQTTSNVSLASRPAPRISQVPRRLEVEGRVYETPAHVEVDNREENFDWQNIQKLDVEIADLTQEKLKAGQVIGSAVGNGRGGNGKVMPSERAVGAKKKMSKKEIAKAAKEFLHWENAKRVAPEGLE